MAIQHVRCETLGTIGDVLGAAEIPFEVVRTFEGRPVPNDMEGRNGLIIMGGPMGVYELDQFPFLRQEIRLIEEAVQQDIPLLGICLGSQLLAAALGADVTPGKKKEIGWYPVTLAQAAAGDPLWTGLGSSFMAYHWHGDVFELPSGAVSLASSELTPHQAIRYGRSAYGVLFHMEVTEHIIEDMVKTFQDELQSAGLNGLGIVQQTQKHLPGLGEIGKSVFTRWVGLMKSSRR